MEVTLRDVNEDDLELLMAWRSNPLLYENFYEQDKPLDWETHKSWWESREKREDWIVRVEDDSGTRDVGNVNVCRLDTNEPEVGVYVGEIPLWGEGVGSRAVQQVLDWLNEEGYEAATARIMQDNEGSVRLFEGLGFERIGEIHDGEDKFRVEITDQLSGSGGHRTKDR